MATGKELKLISQKRLTTVRHLMIAEDWEAAVYIMALSLEIALKVASRRALRLESYPQSTSERDKYFKTHNFDRLLQIGACADIFKLTGNKDAFDNWSQFTSALIFGGTQVWIVMRYDPRMLALFMETKAKEMYIQLYEDGDSILKAMTRKSRW
jgi:hypothetical protein